MSDKQPEPKLVGVTLAKPHTHTRVNHASGEKIKVTEPERDWLATHKIIHNAPKAQEGAK